ncbi:MAG: hypothetical protein LBD28_03195 [Tannerellaceae bacterium]|nr:hypothetical protein [Tannerellaceae bacterium]
MVFISRQAKVDLEQIVIGLLEWEKITLEVSEVLKYVDDIVSVCYGLDTAVFRQRTKYKSHLAYGQYVYPYKRNSITVWYIIYDIDSFQNILVNRIISNHLTAD